MLAVPAPAAAAASRTARAETAGKRAFLDGQHEARLIDRAGSCRFERLDKAGIDHAEVEPFLPQAARRASMQAGQQRAAGDHHAVVAPLV